MHKTMGGHKLTQLNCWLSLQVALASLQSRAWNVAHDATLQIKQYVVM